MPNNLPLMVFLAAGFLALGAGCAALCIYMMCTGTFGGPCVNGGLPTLATLTFTIPGLLFATLALRSLRRRPSHHPLDA